MLLINRFDKLIRISSFCRNYSFLRLKSLDIFIYLVSAITLLLCSKCCGNYLRAETIQGRKLFAEIRYTQFGNGKFQCDKSRNTEFILMCLASAQKNAQNYQNGTSQLSQNNRSGTKAQHKLSLTSGWRGTFNNGGQENP